MAEIDLEMALMSMTSHGEMNDLHSLIRLLPLVSLAVDKAREPWKDVQEAPALLAFEKCCPFPIKTIT